ncbi:MAG: response regulator [Desulfobulbaceae bacterium]|nr:response regulator [Desulfobulbaceae bacterium]
MKKSESENCFRVLVVDDDSEYREIVARWVTSMGYHCETAEDGQMGADYLRNASCDLVLTDMVMPNMDGMQFLKHIKERYDDTSVIVLTGYSKEYSFRDVIQAGAVDFIEKPFRKEVLEAKIARVIHEKTLRDSYREEMMTKQVLIDLLNISIKNKKLEDVLREFLVFITKFPWLKLEPKGAVFLVSENEKDMLELKAHHNFEAPLQTICSRVPIGRCLCGRAGLACEIVFADQLDSLHENRFEGIQNHGHYCVPISLTGNKLMGVFTLDIKAGTERNEKVETVLKASAKTLAQIINSKQDEATIAAQEQRFRAMTDNMLDAIIMMDNHGRISFWNPAAEKMFGYSSEEVLGRDLHAIIAPERYRFQYEAALKKFSASGRGNAIGKTIEIVGRCKSGKEIPLELSLSTLKVKGTWQAVGIVRNISARKELEKEQERLQKQLRQSQKMQAVGTLAGGIAHDFNNILGSIIGFTDMAMADVPQESQMYRDLRHILAAGNRAKELVGQILTFSRQKEEEFVSVKIQRLLKEAITLLQSSLPENIKIQHDIDDECNCILADPGQIHQVIMNLCTNACHAMGEKEGILRIGLQEVYVDEKERGHATELKSGLYVRMSIADTGTGMESDVVDRIFEPFFTTKRLGEGTGMGLSLVHGIIAELGGRVDVKSKTGQGSLFEVYIPAFFECEEREQNEESSA